MRTRPFPSAAGILLLVPLLARPVAAGAQQGIVTRTRVDAGRVWMARRDASISPLGFAGSGWQGTATYEREHPGSLLAVAVRGAALRMTPATVPSSERVWTGAADARLTRAVRRLGGLHAGLALRSVVQLVQHDFHDAGVASPLFRFSSLGVGPAVRGAMALGRGRIVVHATAPLVSVVDRPYSAIKSGHTRFAPRVVGPRSLRALDAGAALQLRAWRGTLLRVGYDAGYVAADLHGPLRALQHGVTVGVSGLR